MRSWKSVQSSAPTQEKDLFETTQNGPTQSLRSNHFPVSHTHTQPIVLDAADRTLPAALLRSMRGGEAPDTEGHGENCHSNRSMTWQRRIYRTQHTAEQHEGCYGDSKPHCYLRIVRDDLCEVTLCYISYSVDIVITRVAKHGTAREV